MKFAKTLLSRSFRAGTLLALLGMAACTTTIRPDKVRASAPSLDAGEANSGLIAILPDKSAVLTLHAEMRYSGLASQYGYKFAPPVQGNEATVFTNTVFTNGNSIVTLATNHPGMYWQLDAEHLAKFGIMNHWKKEGAK